MENKNQIKISQKSNGDNPISKRNFSFDIYIYIPVYIHIYIYIYTGIYGAGEKKYIITQT